MDTKELISKVAGAAPAVGAALGGPVGRLTGEAIKALAGAFGCEAKPAAIEEAIAASPDALLKLKLAELDFKAKMDAQVKAHEIEVIKTQVVDVQNARAREIAITEKTGKRDWNLYILAWTIVVGFFVLTGLLAFKVLPEANVGPINQLFGAIAAGFGMVVGYFFGSSSSSSKKDVALLAAATGRKDNG